MNLDWRRIEVSDDDMLEVLRAKTLAQVVDAFSRLQIPYLVTGSAASMAYGEPG